MDEQRGEASNIAGRQGGGNLEVGFPRCGVTSALLLSGFALTSHDRVCSLPQASNLIITFTL